jgi:hypothetical protein
MRYDDRYTPLLQRADLHVVAQVVRHGLPNFNAPSLTALIDSFVLNYCLYGFLWILLLYSTDLYCLFYAGGS